MLNVTVSNEKSLSCRVITWMLNITVSNEKSLSCRFVTWMLNVTVSNVSNGCYLLEVVDL